MEEKVCLIFFLVPKDEEKHSTFLPSFHNAQGWDIFPYIIENMKWKRKKNLMKLNCAKYCTLCMSSSDLWGHDLLRIQGLLLRGHERPGRPYDGSQKRRQCFSHGANFCKHDGIVHHIFIIQRSDNFKYFFSRAHINILSENYTVAQKI